MGEVSAVGERRFGTGATDDAAACLLHDGAVAVPTHFAGSGKRKTLHEAIVLRQSNLERRAIAGISQAYGGQFAMVEDAVE